MSSSTEQEPERPYWQVVVRFTDGDPLNPHNWTPAKKAMVVVAGALLCITSTMGSALTANLGPYLAASFGLTSGVDLVLPVCVYLIGYIFGPLIFAPFSEELGRRGILGTCAFAFMMAMAGCITTPDGNEYWARFLGFRFLGGVFGSPPLSIVGGVIADVYHKPETRGTMITIWSATAFLGPLLAPILSGFSGPVFGWRWTFGIALAWAAASFVSALFFLPETLATKILRDRTEKLNQALHDDSGRYICLADLGEPTTLSKMIVTSLCRPFRLFFREMIVFLACIYMAFVYAVLYMLLEIFPAIFQGVYGFTPGLSGVAFAVSLGLGTVSVSWLSFCFDGVSRRLSAKYPKRRPEYLRLPIACLGGPVFVVSLLWLGWASREDVHWVVPLLAVVPFGLAYQVIFAAMLNYLTDAYGVYTASGLAACGTTRSIAGALIPLAVPDLLQALGIAWSCTLLAGISAALAIVPFGFIVYGPSIRHRSQFAARYPRISVVPSENPGMPGIALGVVSGNEPVAEEDVGLARISEEDVGLTRISSV